LGRRRRVLEFSKPATNMRGRVRKRRF
jgi:hypothetical protein